MYISFDNPRSIQKKLELIEENRYMGIFAWELTGDTKDYELLNAMNGKNSNWYAYYYKSLS